MREALSVTWYSLRDMWDEAVLLVLLNLVWAVTVLLPLAPILLLESLDLVWVLVLSFLLVLPSFVVSGAVCFVANQTTRGLSVGWGTFLSGIRRYWAKSLVVGVINLVVLILLASNLQFYGLVLQGGWTGFALAAWVVVSLYWLLVQVYWFPMILEMENERIFLGLRNALALVIVTPVFSITIGVLSVVIVGLCLVLTVPAFLFMASLLFLVANHATRSRLAHARKKPYHPGLPPE